MKVFKILAFGFAITSLAYAQPPNGGGRGGRNNRDMGNGDVANRLMKLDINQDGSIDEGEVKDSRLKSLFDRADANGDKMVTKEELVKLVERESYSAPRGPAGGPGGLGFDGRGQPGPGAGPKGPGGFGPPGMGMPRPGVILPEFLIEELRLNESQRKELESLQQTVDSQLAKILSEDQREHLKQLGQRPVGAGNFRQGPGGPNGFGGPGR